MCPLLQLPVEILESIAAFSVKPAKRWQCVPETTVDLDLQLVHPWLAPIFGVALVKHSKIVINPRHIHDVLHLISFLRNRGASAALTHLEILAENFTQRITGLNKEICQLVGLCHRLESLELSLDGHFVQFSDFPEFPALRRLVLQGESLYSHLAYLRQVTPRLTHLDVLSPALSGPPPVTSEGHALADALLNKATSSLEGPAEMPVSLSHVYISNLNAPAGQLLLQHIAFRPTHFTFTLMYNYDLTELAHLLSGADFCRRAKVFHMVKSKLVAVGRLAAFRSALTEGLARRPIRVQWEA
jgi:hypothetical protein